MGKKSPKSIVGFLVLAALAVGALLGKFGINLWGSGKGKGKGPGNEKKQEKNIHHGKSGKKEYIIEIRGGKYYRRGIEKAISFAELKTFLKEAKAKDEQVGFYLSQAELTGPTDKAIELAKHLEVKWYKKEKKIEEIK